MACGVAAATRFDIHIISERSPKEEVVPAAQMIGRYKDVRIVIINRDCFPIVIVVGMGKPVEVIIRQARGSAQSGGNRTSGKFMSQREA